MLDASVGEGWAALGYLLSAAGKSDEGQAASRRATALEPDNWRHHYRLAYGSWGEERLRAVDRTLSLMPGFAPARMLACMVYVARGTLSLKGVKQPVEVPFTWTASGNGAAMEGELTLERGKFGIGAGEWLATDVIGAEVKVRFSVKLRKAG